MRKKQKVIAIIMAVVLLLGILGIGIYVHIPVRIPNVGITMKTSRVTASGLVLHLEREDEDTSPELQKLWKNYRIYEYTAFRWLPVDMDENFIYQLKMRDEILIETGHKYTDEINWTDGCGRLSTGLYRLDKEIGRPNRTVTYSLPFFVINWVQMLGVLLALIVLVLGICFLRRKGLWEKVWSYVISKRKVLLVLCTVILVASASGVVANIFIPRIDKEWGISLQITERTPTEVKYELRRMDEDKLWTLYYSNCGKVEKYTLTGWETLPAIFTISPVQKSILEETTDEMQLDIEEHYGRLSSGIYCVSVGVAVDGNYQYDATGIESKEFIYRAPFVVIVWQEILPIIIGIVFALIFILLERKYKRLPKLWNTMKENKKRTYIVGIILAVVILSSSILISALRSEISAAYWQYKIDIVSISEQQIEGTLTYYKGASKEMDFLRFKNSYLLQAKTWYGWRDVKEIFTGTGRKSVRAGSTIAISFKWVEIQGGLEKGTYRIVQPFDTYLNRELKNTGTIWITFQVE